MKDIFLSIRLPQLFPLNYFKYKLVQIGIAINSNANEVHNFLGRILLVYLHNLPLETSRCAIALLYQM